MSEVEFRPWPRDHRYLVGDDGTILGPWRLPLKHSPLPGGHCGMTLRLASGQRVGTTRHRVVCETFHGPCPPGMQAAHEDGDPLNCRADNLKWKTPRGNCQDKLRHGTYGFKLTEAQVREIKAQPDVARKVLARQYGVSEGMISHIRTGHSWSNVALAE